MEHSFANLAFGDLTAAQARAILLSSASCIALAVGPIAGACLCAGVVSNVAQVGFLWGAEAMKPELSKLDPLKGLTRILSTQGSVEFAKAVAKVTLVAWATLSTLRHQYQALAATGAMNLSESLGVLGSTAATTCTKACVLLVTLAAADYLYQRFAFERRIRMTRQEVRDDLRQSEGDPMVKLRLRQRQREFARRRMMEDVKRADVVVTNPAHLAVALRYAAREMRAPKVVAKGQRLIAERIKEVAKENRIPIVENKPVAQALFKSVKIGFEIPAALYQSVAEILAFVYRLRRR